MSTEPNKREEKLDPIGGEQYILWQLVDVVRRLGVKLTDAQGKAIEARASMIAAELNSRARNSVASERQQWVEEVIAALPKDLEPDNYDDGFAEGHNDALKRSRVALRRSIQKGEDSGQPTR